MSPINKIEITDNYQTQNSIASRDNTNQISIILI